MATSSSRGRSAASDALQPRSRELESVGTAPDGIYETLIECVKAIGGSKVAGIALWPAKGVEASQRHLLACLNPERNEKLGPDEVLHVLRLARERGCHAGMQYLAAALSYAEPAHRDRAATGGPLQRSADRRGSESELIPWTPLLPRRPTNANELPTPA